jgi:DNA-binding transcriptional LysR family regulator
VSSIYSVGLHELHSVQKELLKTHPKVNVRLNYRRSDQVYDDVILGAADIGLVAYPQPRAGVDIIPFREDKLALVLPPGHALASKAKVAMSAVVGLPFIAFDREAPSRKGIDKLFRDKNLELNPTMEMDNVETIKRAVELGLGVSVLPLPTVKREVDAGTLVARSFVEGTFTRPIGILVRKGKYLSRASQAVLDSFKGTRIED